MAVTSYVGKNGESLWKVATQTRSETNLSIRVQKSKFAITSEREAIRVDKDLQRECEREVLVKEAQGSSWGSLVEIYEKHLLDPELSGLQESTRMDYIATIKKYTKGWSRRSAAEISKADIRELFAQMKSLGLSLSHIKRTKIILNRVFIFGMENRIVRGIDDSPTVGIQMGREEEVVPEILTIGEIRKLLSSARSLDHPWYHHWALALLTGMRNGELYALLWTDIDWENNAIMVSKSFSSRTKSVKCTKSGLYRTVPVSSELRSLLMELKAQAGSRATVLPKIRLWTLGLQAGELRKFCAGMGLPSIRFHTLRACFATQLIRNGVPPIQIQKICGWKDLKTMQRYIRLAGIEVHGATEGLKVLPEQEIAAKVVNLFTRDAVQPRLE